MLSFSWIYVDTQLFSYSIQLRTSEEMDTIKDVLFPSILCAAVYTGQTSKLEQLKVNYEADLAVADYDGRTPLHIAASEGI